MDRWAGASSELHEYMADAGYFDDLNESDEQASWSLEDLSEEMVESDDFVEIKENPDRKDRESAEVLLARAHELYKNAQENSNWHVDYLRDYPDWVGVPWNVLVVYQMTRDLLSRQSGQSYGRSNRYIDWAADKLDLDPPSDLEDDHKIIQWLMARSLQELEEIGI